MRIPRYDVMNANRTYTNNKCSERFALLGTNVRTPHTGTRKSFNSWHKHTRNTHRTQSNDRQHLSVVRLNNFSTAFKPCSLLAPPQPPQVTTTIAICSHIISHTRNDWWYCMIATCIVGGIQCVYWRDSFCTGSDTNSIDKNVIVWVREEEGTEKWYSTVDPDSHTTNDTIPVIGSWVLERNDDTHYLNWGLHSVVDCCSEFVTERAWLITRVCRILSLVAVHFVVVYSCFVCFVEALEFKIFCPKI